MTDGEWQAYLDHHPQIVAETNDWPTQEPTFNPPEEV